MKDQKTLSVLFLELVENLKVILSFVFQVINLAGCQRITHYQNLIILCSEITKVILKKPSQGS